MGSKEKVNLLVISFALQFKAEIYIKYSPLAKIAMKARFFSYDKMVKSEFN